MSKIENISDELLLCSETMLAENSSLFHYAELTGDWAGVAGTSGSQLCVQKDVLYIYIVAVVQLYISRWLVELHPPTWPTVKMGAFGSRLPAGWALRGWCLFARSNHLHCILYITGGDGWDVHQGRKIC